MSRRAKIALLILIAGVTVLGVQIVRGASGQSQNEDVCTSNLSATTYPLGLGNTPATNFASTTAISFVTGTGPGTGLQLNTSLTPVNSQHITLPFDQDVKIHYVAENTGNHPVLGWCYADAFQNFFSGNVNTNTSTTMADADSDGVPDFFQKANGTTRVHDGFFAKQTTAGTPDLANSSLNYGDGGNYAHLSNLMEAAITAHTCGIIFFNTEDDAYSDPGESSTVDHPVATDVTYVDPAVLDVVHSPSDGDGIPDYDVNGDGTINATDRTVDLGTLQAGRELLFWMLVTPVYIRNQVLGITPFTTSGTTNYTHASTVWFTKDMMNADFNTNPVNTVIRKTAIGCSRDDSTCYSPLGATLGWLDTFQMNRISNVAAYPEYQGLNVVGITNVQQEVVGAHGEQPHIVSFVTPQLPNLWMFSLDDNASPASKTGTDYDYNDVTFIVERVNGGSVASNQINSTLAANQFISKVRISYTVDFPSPACDPTKPGTSINIYYSVDNGTTWHLADTAVPPNPAVGANNSYSNTVNIDMLAAGLVGTQLKWKADLATSEQSCQPIIQTLNEGYEVVQQGEFKFAAPIPLSNVLYSGSLETPQFKSGENAVTRSDYSIRGHFYSTQLYDPTAPSTTTLTQLWDAGTQLSNTSPTSRKIFTSVSGVTTLFDTAHGSTLYPLILANSLTGSSSTVTPKYNGVAVYDFDGDGNVYNDDTGAHNGHNDARFVLEWTRGWEFPSGVTFTPAQTTGVARGWLLGPVHNSSPAIVGPSPTAIWATGSAAPTAMKTLHSTYVTNNSTRSTIAMVGAQDGMLHAFDAGQFRYGTDTGCPATLVRGCYAGANSTIQYGSGNEKWAWIPPILLSQLKNNHPQTRTYDTSAGNNIIQAEVDGSIAVEDIYVPGSTPAFKTIAYASLGRDYAYISAVDITDTLNPAAIWANDFSDTYFNGSELSPSVALTMIPTSGTAGTFTLVATSGLTADVLADDYLYFLNPLTGVIIDPATGGNDTTTGLTKGRIKLNAGSSKSSYNTQSFGYAGYPNLIDADGDGLVDRVYLVDTLGRIFKYDLKTQTHCVVRAVGDSVYSGMAVNVTGNATAPVVTLYVGSAPNPDGTTPATGHGASSTTFGVYAFQDTDTVGACTQDGASQVFAKDLGANEKVWAAPAMSSSDILYATAASASAGICATGNGQVLDYTLAGTTVGAYTLTGSSVSSFRVYDGHELVNTISNTSGSGASTGSSTVLGSAAWNSAGSSGSGGGTTSTITSLKTLMWYEQ